MFLELLDVAHRYGLATQHDQSQIAKILAACEIGGPLTKDTWNGLIRRESLQAASSPIPYSTTLKG